MTVDWLKDIGHSEDVASRLRALMARPEAVAAPGAHDGMSGLLARNAGFDALYLSGAALSASMGLPDLGLLTLEDVVGRAREIVRASGLPLIVDCDTGFGEALNVMRAVRELQAVGVASIQIEDQQLPKKCGHLNDKRLVSQEEMCRKIAAARQASSDIVICARTDAAADSLNDAIARANAYISAGADLIFVEALTSSEAMRRVRREIRAPLLANMTEFGRTPQTSMSQWNALGFDVVIFPVSAFRASSSAAKRTYLSLAERGDVLGTLDEMMTRGELYETIRYYEYEALDASIAATRLDAT